MKTIQLKRNSFCFSLLLLLMCAMPAMAQLATWIPSGLSGYGPSPWGPTASSGSLTVGGLTRGAGVGVSGTAAANAWGGVNWGGGANQDATFTITANPGFALSYSTFNLSYRRSNTGPNAGTLQYTFGSSTTYTVISAINNFTSTSTSGVPITPINLSGVADLQNVPAGTVVKFRILPTAGSSAGTWYVFGSAGMSINGTISAASTSPSVSIAQTASVQCNGQAGAALTASASGSTGPYTYSWSPSGVTTSTLGNLTAGVYSCLVTSASSATAMATFTVSEPAVLSSSLVSQSNALCNGSATGSATVYVSGGSTPYTYSWSPTGGTSATTGSLTAGNYTLNITDANGCAQSQTVQISEPVVLSSSVSAQTNILCNGSATGAATVSVSGGSMPYTYSWSPTGGTSATTGSLTAGNYTLNISDANGCVQSQTLQISEPVVLSSSVSAQTNILCNGSATGAATVSVNGGGMPYTYSWSPTGGTSDIAASLTAGIYTLNISDANGCAQSQTVQITEPTVLSSSVSAQTNVTCNGAADGSVMVSVNGGNAPYTYAWSPMGGSAAAASSLTAGIYTLNISDANGCAQSQTVQVTEPAAVNVSATASNSVVCSGLPVTLSGTGASTYTWTGGVTDGVSFSPSSTDTYTVYGTDLSGCSGSATVSVLVNQLPAVMVTAAPSATVCPGASLMLSGSGASTYTWSAGIADGVSFAPSASASYTVTGTDANGCTNSAVQAVTVDNLPVVTAAINHSSVCIGGTIILTGGGATTYTWSGGATNGVALMPFTSTTYTVTGANANGCVNTATTSVIVYLLPGVQASSTSTMLCAGQTATLTASGAVTYTWSTSETGSPIAVSPASSATYTVYGTDANGCSNQATVTENVSVCTGIEQWSAAALQVSSYPNPNSGNFTIVSNADIHLLLVNSLGEPVNTIGLDHGNDHRADVQGLPAGVYVLMGQNAAGAVKQKIVVTK